MRSVGAAQRAGTPTRLSRKATQLYALAISEQGRRHSFRQSPPSSSVLRSIPRTSAPICAPMRRISTIGSSLLGHRRVRLGVGGSQHRESRWLTCAEPANLPDERRKKVGGDYETGALSDC